VGHGHGDFLVGGIAEGLGQYRPVALVIEQRIYRGIQNRESAFWSHFGRLIDQRHLDHVAADSAGIDVIPGAGAGIGIQGANQHIK